MQTRKQRLEEMMKAVDDYYDIWIAYNDFDAEIKDEYKRSYFEKEFNRIAISFIEKKTDPTEQHIHHSEMADRFMNYCEKYEYLLVYSSSRKRTVE